MAQKGGYVIGYTNDWSDFEPEAWASSFLIDWSVYYTQQVEAILAGEFQPGISYGGLADRWIDFAPFGPAVTEETLALVDETIAAIKDGSFDMFAGPIMDNQGNEVLADGVSHTFGELMSMSYLVAGVDGEIPAS